VDSDLALLDEVNVDAAPDSPEAAEGLTRFLATIPPVVAVGHRFVHGGPHLTAASLIDNNGDNGGGDNGGVLAQLRQAATMAPQHVPVALAALEASRQRLPDIPHVACLDTAFHAHLPVAARTYALPLGWRREFGVRRYGFHGLSYSWSLARAAELLDRDPADLQVVLTHLGGGASVCAVRNGRSVWTSMGFTPLEGLVMSRRSGTVDPGALLWLQTEQGLTAAEIADALEHHSGLFGLSNELSGDTRELVVAAADGNEAAALALDVFCLRARQEIAAAATSLDRLDALVFSGEIGADQPEVREAISSGLGVLGIHAGLDPRQDQNRIISISGVPVLLVHPDEQRQIALEVRAVLGQTQPAAHDQPVAGSAS
jgi:acetate kinase